MKRIFYILFLASFSIFTFNSCSKDGGALDVGGNTGTGGSLARFTIAGNYLYVVDGETLKAFDITDPQNPNLVSTTQVGWQIETIYPYNGNLFIGSASAMYIYSLNTPSHPQFEGMASHVRACDPVVAKDSFAFVTVRSTSNGSPCGGNTNALMIYNISNLQYPNLITTVNLNNPYGLGIKDKYLYVCDANAGLRVYDISQVGSTAVNNQARQIGVETGYTFKDVIPYNDILICMVDGGMVIYDISDPSDPEFVTKTF